MIIIIRKDLVRKTRFGRSSIFDKIICKTGDEDKKISEYIYKRINDSRLIRVKLFEVFVRDSNDKLVKHFTYSPTYR